jgi:hypothetical protein
MMVAIPPLAQEQKRAKDGAPGGVSGPETGESGQKQAKIGENPINT